MKTRVQRRNSMLLLMTSAESTGEKVILQLHRCCDSFSMRSKTIDYLYLSSTGFYRQPATAHRRLPACVFNQSGATLQYSPVSWGSQVSLFAGWLRSLSAALGHSLSRLVCPGLVVVCAACTCDDASFQPVPPGL